MKTNRSGIGINSMFKVIYIDDIFERVIELIYLEKCSQECEMVELGGLLGKNLMFQNDHKMTLVSDLNQV